MNAILRFEFITSLVVAEHILSSTVALKNYLQKTDIDLIESLTEAKIVIHRQLVKDLEFSAMRRIKSYLRSTMGDERLSNLSLLHIHRHLNVDVGASITNFIGRTNRRLDFD